MTSTVVECARALAGGETVDDFAFAFGSDGVIKAAGPAATLRAALPDAPRRTHGADRLIVPGCINGHSHAYQILLRGWADDLPFERWRNEALYRIVPRLTPDHVYWTFCAAFGEMLRNGITTVVEFFYLNGHGGEHAEAALRAARDTGIRLLFARTWMDAACAPAAFRETIAGAAEGTRDLIDRHPGVPVFPAPHSLHAASPEMIGAAVAFARERGLPVHMHVAEAEYENVQVQAAHGATPVRFLANLGALYDGFVAVHAVFVDDEEREILARAGAAVVHNPTTNQYLGDGVCALSALVERGVPVALGTDADVRPSIYDEMRAAALLQKVAQRRGEVLDARAAWHMGTAGGARALGVPAGDLRPGMFADYVEVAWDRADVHPWTPPLNALVYGPAAAAIVGTYVGGMRADGTRVSPARLSSELRRLAAELDIPLARSREPLA